MSTAPTRNELDALAEVASQLQSQGVELGDYEYEPEPLTIDFVFRDAQPRPVAIEITGVIDGSEMSGADAAVAHVKKPLNILARNESWGCWVLALNVSARMKPVKHVVAELIRNGTEIRPGDYTVEDLAVADLAGKLDNFLARHRDLVKLGVIELSRCIDPHDVVARHPELAKLPSVQIELAEYPRDEVKVIPIAGVRTISGVVGDLVEALFNNADKLRAAVDFERHLVVEVVKWYASRDPRDTPVPPLPPEIDRLWVLHRRAEARGWPHVWWVDRHQSEWSIASSV